MLAAIIQARMGSSRLPGKTLADIHGKPMLERFIERVRGSRYVERVIIATTSEERDRPIVEFAQSKGWALYRGSELDVLDRFYQAARDHGVDEILRVTPDCPLLDPRLIDQVVERYRSGSFDYASNTLGRSFPDGMDAEVFSFEALEKAHREATRASEREHVTLYLKTSGRFRTAPVEASEDYSRLKWSVDKEEDLAFVRAVYQRLGEHGHPFRFEEILRLVQETPELARINSGEIVNEGYFRSILRDSPVPEKPRSLKKSSDLLRKTLERIPGASQTFSKGPTQFVEGVAPAFAVRGKGCRLWDPDGNEYLDCGMALGAAILGYADDDVDAAAAAQLKEGASFTLPHPLELEVAETLARIIPCAEMVRFGKNGSDATSGAVRAARALTGRDLIAVCGYHGWQDWFIGTTTRNLGVPEAVRKLALPFQYNRIESLERIFSEHPGQLAAVILEPVGLEEPKEDFLRRVKELAHREGALLIFDEVLTGFRFGLAGAHARWGVSPDLICVGKAIANGFPLSAVAGRREAMKIFEEVFFSFTFGGEAVSLAAARATLKKLEREKVETQLWRSGLQLKEGYNLFARGLGLAEVTQCVGLPPRTVVQFKGKDEPESLALKSFFQQECLKRGLLFTGYHLPSHSHREAEVDQILRVYCSAMKVLAEAVEKKQVAQRLEGRPVQPVFRQP